MTNKLTDEQVKTIKEQFAKTLATTLYEVPEMQDYVYIHLNDIAQNEDNISVFVNGLGTQVLDVVERIKAEQGDEGNATLTMFIRAGIKVDEENLDKDVSNYNLLVDNAATLNATKRSVSGNTPTSVDIKKCLNVLNTTGDNPFALLWMNEVQAIVMVGGESEHAGMITFRDNGMYDIMYVNPDLGKVHRLIVAMADEALVKFQMVELREPLKDMEAEGLTLEVFKGLAVKSSEIYKSSVSNGSSQTDALIAAGIEGWALDKNLDLNTVRLHIPELDAMRAHAAALADDLEDEPLNEMQDNSVISDAVVVEKLTEDRVQHTVTTTGGREIVYSRDTKDDETIHRIYKVIDNILADDGRLLNIASTKELSPRLVFSNLVLNRTNALKPLGENGNATAKVIANEVFDALLPHLDEVMQEYNQSTKDVYIKSTPELVATIANNNKLHARGLSKLSEENQAVIFEDIAALPAMAKFEKDYDDEYEQAVIDNLNRIAPFDYNSEILNDGVMLNQLIVAGDETGEAYRGTYVRNVLIEEYEKLSSKDVVVAKSTVRELSSTGSSSGLFAMGSDKLRDLVNSLDKPRTYVVEAETVLLLVSKITQDTVDEEDANRTIYLYSVINKAHANNIVIVKSDKPDALPVYTLTSSTTYQGIADIAEYVKSILI